MTTVHRAIAASALTAALLIVPAGCGASRAAKAVLEQGVEPTSAGPHNTAPANAAQNAVDSLNGSVQQAQQDAQNAGQ